MNADTERAFEHEIERHLFANGYETVALALFDVKRDV